MGNFRVYRGFLKQSSSRLTATDFPRRVLVPVLVHRSTAAGESRYGKLIGRNFWKHYMGRNY